MNLIQYLTGDGIKRMKNDRMRQMMDKPVGVALLQRDVAGESGLFPR